jgi:hypothetical protein
MPTGTLAKQAPATVAGQRDASAPWYLAAVLVGSVLIVWAAINQPYNQNEIAQITPYSSDSIAVMTSGTRQPPLDALLGGLVQHVLGVGQIQQRLVEMLSGVGALVLVALLLRRLRIGAAGVVALWVMATAPLLVRYSAYARPYALPLFLMVLFVFATEKWLDTRRRPWLVMVAATSLALPVARVPEPVVFLLTSVVVLGWLAFRGRLSWRQVSPVIGVVVTALAVVGYPMYRTLAAETGGKVFDPSPSGILHRFPRGVDEILTGLLPLLGEWMPWWPVTVLLVLAVLILRQSRRMLLRCWYFWPLLVAPVVFALAYHFLNPYPFDIRPYRARFAIFFVPAHALVVAALVYAATQADALSQRWRKAVVVLVAAVLLTPLPKTVEVLVENEAADFARVADVLTSTLPDDAVVVYDTPSPVGMWRQPFIAKHRYMGDVPAVGYVKQLAERPRLAPTGPGRPVFVLILDSRCAYSVVCDIPPQRWHKDVPGWEVRSRIDKFTLYEPTGTASGRPGMIKATRAFGKAMTPRLGYVDTFLAARLLQLRGRAAEGRALLERMYQTASPALAREIHEYFETEMPNVDQLVGSFHGGQQDRGPEG